MPSGRPDPTPEKQRRHRRQQTDYRRRVTATTRHTGLDPYSYAPRGLDRAEAARYVGVGMTKFDEMVADGRMPKPKRVDGRVIWDRLKIEAAFSDLPEERALN